MLTGLIGFDDPGLLILPYYRVVRNATPVQLAKLRDILSLYFVARPAGVAAEDASALDAVVATLGQGQVTLGVVDKGRPLQVLTPANDIIPEPDPEATPQTQVRSVEAFVLQEMLLRPVFGDAFPDHVAYVHEGEQAMEMVERGDGQVAFFVKGAASRRVQVGCWRRDPPSPEEHLLLPQAPRWRCRESSGGRALTPAFDALFRLVEARQRYQDAGFADDGMWERSPPATGRRCPRMFNSPALLVRLISLDSSAPNTRISATMYRKSMSATIVVMLP